MDVGQERGGDQHDKWLRTRSKPSELPNEIFGLILCLVQRNGWINPAPLPAEVTLSHVCRHWRRFTLALPSLWSVFRYDGSHFATHRERVPVKRLAVYLERSKQHPVELFFDLDHFQEDHLGDWTDVLSMVEQIIPHLQRVRELHVLSFKDKIDKFLSKLVDASAPLLEALTIRGEWQPELMESADSKWSPQIFTGGTPSLKYLRFDDKPFSQPPIQSIVHLRLEEVPEMESLEEEFSPSMLRELLSLPYLETFSIWGTFVTVPLEMVVASMPKMESKTLKHFRCGGGLRQLAQFFLSHVSAPSLETLTFHSFDFEGSPPSWIATIGFPSLHTLSLVCPETADTPQHIPWLWGLMTTTRNIKKLVLSLFPQDKVRAFLDTLHGLSPGHEESPGFYATNTPWSDTMEELILDMASSDFEVGDYTRLTYCLPKLALIRTTPAMKHNIDLFADLARQAPGLRRPAEVQCIGDVECVHPRTPQSEEKPIIPLYWTLGPDWIDGEWDPFHFACVYNTK
ncbi:hypothetical protein DFP72DRAFT_888521 [Ephemerocybe angulata]|uniref:F-box domain-containing protein n=1 Tax=Ephemerocybe angulata TaxID=980116 RepID=A0A8H6MAQ8_9AGAR|nr:hypothetical protein DFP72DRAFT_888521 [Tulosesus angulatus]